MLKINSLSQYKGKNKSDFKNVTLINKIKNIFSWSSIKMLLRGEGKF